MVVCMRACVWAGIRLYVISTLWNILKPLYTDHKNIMRVSKQFHTVWSIAMLQWQTLKNSFQSVRIQSFSGPYFPASGLNTERHGISMYSACMNSEYGHFLHFSHENSLKDKAHLVISEFEVWKTIKILQFIRKLRLGSV